MLCRQLHRRCHDQCTIVFRSDGAILLVNGGTTGTVVATYTGAFPVASTWYSFECEVTINNTTGTFKVRKNGNTVDDFSAASLDTQNSANAYANKIQVGCGAGVIVQQIDDLFWRSDASSVAWMGDVRCYTRMPTANSSVQFTAVGTRTFVLGNTGGVTSVANRAIYSPLTLTYDGTITSVFITTSGTYTGNIKGAIYADGGANAPTTILGTAINVITNTSIASVATFTFSPITVVVGQKIWFAYCTDTANGSSVFLGSAGATGLSSTTTTYAAFPAANPTSLASGSSSVGSVVVTMSNAGAVADPQQDTTTTYVYDSTAGHADLYTIATIGSTPSSTLAVTTRAYMLKSDTGSRTAAVQLKSGATTVASSTLTLTTSGWQWTWRTDTVDPNTSAAWVAANVDAALIGPTVIA